jgi:hypothetical protein
MIPAKKADDITPASIEAGLIKGDLSKFTDEQRLEYHNLVCKLAGLNPLTRPFDYLYLNGKLVLYPNKSCAEQLRKIHGISLEIISQDLNADGLYTVRARAKDDAGRTDEDVGVVTLGQARSGEAVANMILKCVTKAKRRVTLSICGLGFLDSEGDDAPRSPERRRQPLRLYPADEKAPDEKPGEQVNPLEAADIPPHAFEVPKLADGADDWHRFAIELVTVVRASGERAAWMDANKATLGAMRKAAPKEHANLLAAVHEAAGADEGS